LRIGSVLENYGTEVERMKAIEWLAWNRDDLLQNASEAAYELSIVIGDLPISNELASDIVQILVASGLITKREYKEKFSNIGKASANAMITVTQLSRLINSNAAYYNKC